MKKIIVSMLILLFSVGNVQGIMPIIKSGRLQIPAGIKDSEYPEYVRAALNLGDEHALEELLTRRGLDPVYAFKIIAKNPGTSVKLVPFLMNKIMEEYNLTPQALKFITDDSINYWSLKSPGQRNIWTFVKAQEKNRQTTHLASAIREHYLDLIDNG